MPITDIQLWISCHARTPYRPENQRDIQRARNSGRGADCIWLLPWISEPFGWSREIEIECRQSRNGNEYLRVPYTFRQVAIKSEEFDRIDVVHIDAERRTFAPGLKLPMLAANDSRLPSQMYRKWIMSPDPGYVAAPGYADFEVPMIERGSVSSKHIRLTEAPGPIMPFGSVDAAEPKIELCWPPPGKALPETISPEAESVDFYGDLHFAGEKSEHLVATANDPDMQALLVHPVWPSPFDQCFPLGGGFDLIAGRAEIRRLALKGGTTAADVIPAAAPYLSEGTSTVEKSWFWPRLCGDGAQNVLADAYSKYSLDHASIAQIFQDSRYQEIAKREIPVQQVWGWLGYFWLEFVTDLQSGQKVRSCHRCGALIQGQKNKRFCGESENPECYRKRRTSDRRADRACR